MLSDSHKIVCMRNVTYRPSEKPTRKTSRLLVNYDFPLSQNYNSSATLYNHGTHFLPEGKDVHSLSSLLNLPQIRSNNLSLSSTTSSFKSELTFLHERVHTYKLSRKRILTHLLSFALIIGGLLGNPEECTISFPA